MKIKYEKEQTATGVSRVSRRKLIVIIIFIFSIISIWAVITQRPNQDQIKQTSEESVNTTSSDMLGATNIRSFSDIYSPNNANTNTNRALGNKSAVVARPVATPRPPPYPRITINYTSQNTKSIRGISPGANNSFILVSVDIRNYGYPYFDADPSKFRSGSLEPILNVSTGNMLNEVVPNNSETIGDLVFLVKNNQGFPNRLSYNGDYTIIYNFGGQTGGSGRRNLNYVNPNSE